MRGCNIPADEARLHPFTPLQHPLLCITSCSVARGNDGRCDSQKHPPYRWISRALVRQRPGPGKPRLLVLFRVCVGFWQEWDSHCRSCIFHYWSQIPKLRVKLDVGKVLTAHSALEVVFEIHQHPTWLRYSSD